ncbi:MAG: LysM peptidoglycan-binding domain-containing protein, partial [Candidatus Brocadiia bacterium]
LSATPSAESILVPLVGPEGAAANSPSPVLPADITENPFFPPTPAPADSVDASGKVLIPLVTPAVGANSSNGGLTSNPDDAAKKGVESLPKASKRYTVAKGDSLEIISKKFYGKKSLWKKIADANNITNPASLKIGQVLVIPEVESAPADKSANGTPDNKPAKGNAVSNADEGGKTADSGEAKTEKEVTGDIYTVVSGDSLWKIAKKVYGNGDLWKIIYEANRKVLSTPSALKVGMKLIIPPKDSSKAADKKEAPKAGTPAPEKAPSNGSKPGIAKSTPDKVEVINFYEEN